MAYICLPDGTEVEFLGRNSITQINPIDYDLKVSDNHTMSAPEAKTMNKVDSIMQLDLALEEMALNDPLAYEQHVLSSIAEGMPND